MLAQPGVHHLKVKVGVVCWQELPERVNWLRVDVNLAPRRAARGRAADAAAEDDGSRCVITLKLNDWAFVDGLSAPVGRIQQLGLPTVRSRHLPSNRREVLPA